MGPEDQPGGFQHHPEYDQLPEVLQRQITPEEFAWLGNAGRHRLIEDICYPDWEEA